MGAFDIYFIGFNAKYLRYKGACHDSQADPLDAPLADTDIINYIMFSRLTFLLNLLNAFSASTNSKHSLFSFVNFSLENVLLLLCHSTSSPADDVQYCKPSAAALMMFSF